MEPHPHRQKRGYPHPTRPQKKEAEIILGILAKDDFLVALDEQGKTNDLRRPRRFHPEPRQRQHKKLVFLIGGVYGLDESILKRADYRWSLSQLTLPHQLVRLLLAEQLYRACTILRNEKYHHA
ncbi:23S rRNA (pseudouridine(1915)-N(3))-methyltransferase RlmH [Puia sp. P3]|uniref:23S rRNA (pseudouridine(1915)-N(3))-methyltransferase RlmH n=1 Tax=Puia sp. P3 TaxID=3423952 RepID=UPI003D678703